MTNRQAEGGRRHSDHCGRTSNRLLRPRGCCAPGSGSWRHVRRFSRQTTCFADRRWAAPTDQQCGTRPCTAAQSTGQTSSWRAVSSWATLHLQSTSARSAPLELPDEPLDPPCVTSLNLHAPTQRLDRCNHWSTGPNNFRIQVTTYAAVVMIYQKYSTIADKPRDAFVQTTFAYWQWNGLEQSSSRTRHLLVVSHQSPAVLK